MKTIRDFGFGLLLLACTTAFSCPSETATDSEASIVRVPANCETQKSYYDVALHEATKATLACDNACASTIRKGGAEADCKSLAECKDAVDARALEASWFADWKNCRSYHLKSVQAIREVEHSNEPSN